MKLTPFQTVLLIWSVLMIGCGTMIVALKLSQPKSMTPEQFRQQFRDRSLTPPPYVCTGQQREEGECL